MFLLWHFIQNLTFTPFIAQTFETKTLYIDDWIFSWGFSTECGMNKCYNFISVDAFLSHSMHSIGLYSIHPQSKWYLGKKWVEPQKHPVLCVIISVQIQNEAPVENIIHIIDIQIGQICVDSNSWLFGRNSIQLVVNDIIYDHLN